MDPLTLALELLKILLSGPAVALEITVVFVILFRANVAALIDRIATIKFPGGEVATRPQPPHDDNNPSVTVPPPPAGHPEIPGQLHLTPDQQQKLADIFNAENQRATLWEYRYLNYFLVQQTQQVLDWLVAQPNGSTSRPLYEASWLWAIPDPQHRQAVITALQAHELIAITGEHIQLTEKGRLYVTWRGPLPPPPKA